MCNVGAPDAISELMLNNWGAWFCFVQVEALAVQLTQREGELIQEKAEVKKLANFLKQVCLAF